jgi:uncharacterized protein (DUF1800 family)
MAAARIMPMAFLRICPASSAAISSALARAISKTALRALVAASSRSSARLTVLWVAWFCRSMRNPAINAVTPKITMNDIIRPMIFAFQGMLESNLSSEFIARSLRDSGR